MGQSTGSRDATPPWTLEELGRVVSPSGDPADTLATLVQLVQDRCVADACSLYLLESERATLVLSAAVGLDPENVGRTGVRIGEGPIGAVAESRRPLVYPSFIGVPLVHRTLLQGVIVMQARSPRVFTDADGERLMKSSDQLAPLVSQARAEARRLLECHLVERAKAELLDTLAAGISHELNNKLMPIASYAELMLEDAGESGSDDLKEGCATIRDSVFEAARILEQLVCIANIKPTEHGPCDLAATVRDAVADMQPAIDAAGVHLTQIGRAHV